MWPSITRYLCYCYAMFIEGFRSKTNLVVPVDGERIEGIGTEIRHVLKFTTDSFLHQRNKVDITDLTIVKSESENIVPDIFCGCYT